MRDSIWAFLEQYDLPVVVGSPVGKSDQFSQVSAWLRGIVISRFFNSTSLVNISLIIENLLKFMLLHLFSKHLILMR